MKENHLTSRARCRVARQAVEAVIFIHEKGVIHSDLSVRQFLVDKNCNIRLPDFGGSSLQGSDTIVMGTAIHFLPRDEDLPNTVQSDLFALGSTIYEIMIGKKPYKGMGDEEIQHLYSAKVFLAFEAYCFLTGGTLFENVGGASTSSHILKDILSALAFLPGLAMPSQW